MKHNNEDIYPPPPPEKFIRETINRIAEKFVLSKKLSYVYAVGFKWKPSKYNSTPAQIGFFLHDPKRKQHEFPFQELPRTINLTDLYGTKDPESLHGLTHVYSKYKIIGRYGNRNGHNSGSSQHQYFIQPGERIYGSTHNGQLSLGSIGGLLRFSQGVRFRNFNLNPARYYVLTANHVFPVNSNTAYQPVPGASGPEMIGQVVVRDTNDDFALVEIFTNRHIKVRPDIKSLGAPRQPAANMLASGQSVKKSGVSGVTTGTVDYVSVAVLNPSSNQIDTHAFTILPAPGFATDGDSGSIVVREVIENGNTVFYPIGILNKMSANNPYPSIIDKLPGNIYYFARNFLDITTLTQAAVVQPGDTI